MHRKLTIGKFTGLIEIDGGTEWTAELVALSPSVDWETVRLQYGERLDVLKDQAKEKLTELLTDSGESWNVRPVANTSNIKFAWTLETRGVEVSIHRNPCARIPGLRVQIRASALLIMNLNDVDALVVDLLAAFGLAYRSQKYSRLDVALTLANDSPLSMTRVSADVHNGKYITTFRSLSRFGSASRNDKTITFGKRPGVEFCIYDKSAELNARMRSGDNQEHTNAVKKFFHISNYIGTGYWLRFEWRLGREFLRENCMNSSGEVLTRLSSALAKVSKMIRFTKSKPTRGNQTRTPISDWWIVVCQLFEEGAKKTTSQDVGVYQSAESAPCVTSCLKASAAYFARVVSAESIRLNEDVTDDFIDRIATEHNKHFKLFLRNKLQQNKDAFKASSRVEFVPFVSEFPEFSQFAPEV